MVSSVAVIMEEREVENVKNAIEIVCERTQARIHQKDFLTLILKNSAGELAEMAMKTMRKNIDKIE
jgi:hypothetical protein